MQKERSEKCIYTIFCVACLFKFLDHLLSIFVDFFLIFYMYVSWSNANPWTIQYGQLHI